MSELAEPRWHRRRLRRPFEVLLGGLMLLYLYPLYGFLEIWRILAASFKTYDPVAGPPPAPTEVPIPPDVGIPVTGRVTSGSLDRALGGGVPMGHVAMTAAALPPPVTGMSGMSPPVKEQLYDTEVLDQRDDRAHGLGDWMELPPPVITHLEIRRTRTSGGQGGIGYCGKILGKVGFGDEIQKRWGGGRYEVSGMHDGKRRCLSMEIAGVSKPILGRSSFSQPCRSMATGARCALARRRAATSSPECGAPRRT